MIHRLTKALALVSNTLVDSGGSRYISMNTQIPPFDDINVRKAVIAAADRDALVLASPRREDGGPHHGPQRIAHVGVDDDVVLEREEVRPGEPLGRCRSGEGR